MFVKLLLLLKVLGVKKGVGVGQRFLAQSSLGFEKIGNLLPRPFVITHGVEGKRIIRGDLSSI